MQVISAGEAFIDTEIALRAEFNGRMTDSVVILGGWVLAKKININDLHKQYRHIIVFNQEQLIQKQMQFLTPEYFALLKQADEVWDYDDYNLAIMRHIRPDVKLHLLKPCNELNCGESTHKSIDVLFYGWMNDHRRYILDELKRHSVNVVIANAWGNDLNAYIKEAKLCLNVHFYTESALQEQARMIRWVSSHANIISEPSRINYLNVHEVSYTNLVKEIVKRVQ